jgi:arginine N-succinyltransferase
MHVIRSVTKADLPALQQLARSLNTVNLPDNADELKAIVTTSERSFSGRIQNPFHREFVFVLEDTASGEIVGTSTIIAQHGTRHAPHIYLDVLEDEKYSPSVDRHFRHTVLRIGFDYDGPTEIGGLVLDASRRGHPAKLGKQLSFVRFLFMAMHREGFRDRVLAELLPPLRDDGSSVLWEALGRRFTGMDYAEADLISKHNKEFIKSLFPSSVIFTTVLDEGARDVVGAVGPKTEGVRKMLESIGFEPVDRVDPFDGGPHFEAETDSLWPVRDALAGNARITSHDAIAKAPGAWATGLVALEPPTRRKAGRFRAVLCDYRRPGDDVVELPEDAAAALCLKKSDSVWTLAFATHERR